MSNPTPTGAPRRYHKGKWINRPHDPTPTGALEEHPRFWLAKGGSGFDGGLDGIKASTFTGEGLVQVLCDYRDYLREIHEAALAAERRKSESAQTSMANAIELLQQQLAAKRKRGEVGKFIIDQEREIQQLREAIKTHNRNCPYGGISDAAIGGKR